MLLAEIAQYLEDSSIGLTRGLNLIEGFLPKDPGICVGLIETPGLSNVRTFAAGLAGVAFERPRLQVQVRDELYDNARALMNTIEGLLEGIGNAAIESEIGTRYGAILAVAPPILFDRLPDEQLTPYVIVAQNFQIIKKRSAA